MHPATWFKVEFPEHRVVTFRPSALRPVGDDGKPLPSLVHMHYPHASHSHTPKKAASHSSAQNSGGGSGGSGGKDKPAGENSGFALYRIYELI